MFTEAIKRARADGVVIPEAFIPRRCRASFVTAMRSARADYADLQAYVGQSVRTVLSQHYDHVSISRLEEIADLAQDMHDCNGCFSLAGSDEIESGVRTSESR